MTMRQTGSNPTWGYRMKARVMIAIVMGMAALAAPAMAEDTESWADKISFTGYLDTRVQFYTWTPDVDENVAKKISSSDIKVFEAAVAPHVDINDYITADAVFYYVDGSNGDHSGRTESLTIDEFYLIAKYGFDKGKAGEIWAKMGKYYPPVGDFTTYGPGYTRVQDLFWTRVSGLGVGYTHKFATVSAHVFNGSFDTVQDDNGVADPGDDTIGDIAAALAVYPLANLDDQVLEIGGYYLSDATETLRGMGGLLMAQDIANTPADATDDVVLYDANVPAYGGYINGVFTVNDMFAIGVAGEYATTGEFDELEYVDAAGEATAISATHGELALMFDKKRVQVGGKYAGVSGLDWLGTAGLDPEFEPTTYTQFGGYVGTDYIDGLHLAVQFLTGSDSDSNTDSLAELQAKVVF